MNIRLTPHLVRIGFHVEGWVAWPHRVSERFGARQTLLQRQRAARGRELLPQGKANGFSLGFGFGDVAKLLRKGVHLGISNEERHPRYLRLISGYHEWDI